MRKTKREIGQEEVSKGTEWMTTYSDMVTLLLTFFILLFSMATIDKQKFQQVASSLSAAFMNKSSKELYDFKDGTDVYSITENINLQNILNEGEDAYEYGKGDGDEIDAKNEMSMEAEKLNEFVQKVEELILDMELGEHVKIIDEKTYITLRINSVILFDLGKADIKQSGVETLGKIGELLRDLDREAAIQGHTDNLPINTLLFPTNWELSTKRATNVVLFLVSNSNVDPTKLTATGNGEFRPIAPNDTTQNRQKNRRIDIVIDK